MGPEDCEPIDIHLVPRWDKVKQYLTSRRSIRTFINKPIEKDKIEQLLDIARFAPNGANRQVIKWIVINDSAKAHQISEMTIDWMKAVKEKNPALYQEAKLELFVEFLGLWCQDRISRGAPCVIVACAPKDERTAPPAAMIAIASDSTGRTCTGLGNHLHRQYQYSRSGLSTSDRITWNP